MKLTIKEKVKAILLLTLAGVAQTLVFMLLGYAWSYVYNYVLVDWYLPGVVTAWVVPILVFIITTIICWSYPVFTVMKRVKQLYEMVGIEKEL